MTRDSGSEDTDKRQRLLDALQPWTAAYSRPAWRPLVKPGEPSRSRSKFRGPAWLLPRESAPICKLCGRELQLFLQLDLDELPNEIVGTFGSGLLQLFYCIGQDRGEAPDGKPECWAAGAEAPFSNTASLVRVVASDGPPPTARRPDRFGEFSSRAIVGWERFEDYPAPRDLHATGLTQSYELDHDGLTLECPSVGLDVIIDVDDFRVEDVAVAAEKDKLSGWPCWMQGNEQPSCPKCGEWMRLVFQLDSEDHVPFMFGHMGIGHITQCPTHHDVVAFGWACC